MTDGTLWGPLPGLSVRLVVDGASVAESATDEDGCYRLRWEGDGRASLDGAPARVRVEVLDAAGRLLGVGADSLALEPGEDLEVDLAVPAQTMTEGEAEPTFLNGEPVHLAHAARLSVRGLRDAYGYLKHPHRDTRNIDLIQRAFPNTRQPWLEPPFALGECAESWGDAMRRLLAERGAPMGEHDADDLPAGAPIRLHYGERVVVRFTTDDAYPQDRVDPALPVSDQEVTLQSGVSIGWVRHRLPDLNVENSDVAPAYVQRVALLCDTFLEALTKAPLSLLDPRAGADRLEVRIFHQKPFAATTHPAIDHIQVAPDNPDEVGQRALPYVLLLRSAYRYNDTSRARGLRDVVRHGGASMVSEMLSGQATDRGVDPNLALPMASSLLDDPDGPKKAARFARRMWRYFARQHGVEPPSDEGVGGGFDFFREMLVAAADDDLRFEPAGMRFARSGLPWWGSFDHFVAQGGDRGPRLSRETSWGNWLVANVVDGLGVTTDERRFQLAERDRNSSPGGRESDRAILGPNGDLRVREGRRTRRHVAGLPPWSARVFRVRPRRHESVAIVSVQMLGVEGLDDVLVQVLRIGEDGSLLELHRSDDASFFKVVNFEGLDSLLVIVSARESGGSLSLAFEGHAQASDVMITPPNARAGSETCVDPTAWAWTWLSPDIMVDNDDDGRADELLPFGVNNKLKVRLRNRGNIRSERVVVRFWYQPASPTPVGDGWMPLLDAQGQRQELSGVRLDPDEFRWFTVNWAPADDSSGETGFRVGVELVELRREGDPRPPANRDNKISSTVVKKVRPLNDPDFIDVTVRSVNSGVECGICPVPHGSEWTAESEDTDPVDDPQFGVSHLRFRLTRRGERWPLPEGTKEVAPSPRHYYPIDVRTLPPGVSSDTLITVVAHAEDEALSGMSFEVGPPESRVIEPTGPPVADGSGPVTLLS